MLVTLLLEKNIYGQRETGGQDHNYVMKYIHNQKRQQLIVVQPPYKQDIIKHIKKYTNMNVQCWASTEQWQSWTFMVFCRNFPRKLILKITLNNFSMWTVHVNYEKLKFQITGIQNFQKNSINDLQNIQYTVY